MPVFYLLVVLLAVVAGAGMLFHRRPEHEPPSVATANLAREAPKPALRPAPTPEKDDGILRTPDGLRRKVVVKDLDLVCRNEPTGGVPVGEPLDYFSIYFVFGESPEGQPKRFEVGTRTGPPLGWVPAESVLEWNTRLMAKPTPSKDRPRLLIYRDKVCLLDALAQRTCPRHQGACPLEGEEQQLTVADRTPAAGLPILSSVEIPEPDGTRRTIFEVASLVRDLAPLPIPQEPPPDLRPALKRIYIAFAIDTTRSMQASLDAVKSMATSLVADTAKRYADVTLKLALVEYRDADPAYGFRSRIATRFTDPARFQTEIGGLTVSQHADGSVDESVFDGVARALPPAPEETRGKAEHLDWPTGRAGELATKVLILLGDAPDHAQDLTEAEKLAAIATDSGITIASLLMPGGRVAFEEKRYKAQWTTLATESFRPKDSAKGFVEPIPPLLLELGHGNEIAGRLQSLIDDRVDHARKLAALAAAEAEQRLKQYVNSQGLEMSQVYPVLVDLHRGEPAPKTRPDPRFQGRKAPSVRKGWIARSIGDTPLVSVEILMSRAELDALIEELTALQQAAHGNAQDVKELLRIGTAAASGETAFLAADRGDETFAEHLRRRQGLPAARPESLLRRTQTDLLQADELYRSALDERLAKSIRQLIRRRDEPDWNDPARTIQGMALVPYDAIDF
jgi:hypothetical protein